jgi:hypothetical protein
MWGESSGYQLSWKKALRIENHVKSILSLIFLRFLEEYAWCRQNEFKAKFPRKSMCLKDLLPWIAQGTACLASPAWLCLLSKPQAFYSSLSLTLLWHSCEQQPCSHRCDKSSWLPPKPWSMTQVDSSRVELFVRCGETEISASKGRS